VLDSRRPPTVWERRPGTGVTTWARCWTALRSSGETGAHAVAVHVHAGTGLAVDCRHHVCNVVAGRHLVGIRPPGKLSNIVHLLEVIKYARVICTGCAVL
jgi:hypothetical protein